MGDTCQSTGFDGEHLDLPGLVTCFAVLGSALGLLAALLLGG
jgi:hypothetical protein